MPTFPYVGRRGNVRRRNRTDLATYLRPFLSECLHIERGRIHRFRNAPGRSLEPVQHLLDCGHLRVGRNEPLFLHLRRYLADQLASRAGNVGERSHHPNGRRPEREYADQLQSIAGGASKQKVLGQLRLGRISAFDLPDLLDRWQNRGSEKDRARTEQSFLVPKDDIVAQGYDLSLNRYKEIVHDEIEHRAPLEIIADIETLEEELAKGLAELKAMLS